MCRLAPHSTPQLSDQDQDLDLQMKPHHKETALGRTEHRTKRKKVSRTMVLS